MANYYNKDLYKILNVNFDASIEEIKSAYRKLARIYHPDVAKTQENADKFKEIHEAYEILINEQSRKKYDILRGFYHEKIKKDYKQEKKEEQNKYDRFVKQAKEKVKEKEDLTKEPFTKSINEALDNLFYGKKLNKRIQKNNPPIDGDDITVELFISCFEAIHGTNKKVNILHTEPCTNCEGKKFINGAVCPKCSGSGEQSLHKKINVRIPQGVKTGSKVRILKEGNKGRNGGQDGDLYLNITVKKHPHFEIDKLDILCNLPITPAEAALGADILLPFPDGNITLKIPPNTSSGQKLKIAAQGLENKTKTKKGDIIVTVQIKIPKNLSQEEKELYRKLKEIASEDIRKDFNNEK